MQRSIVLFSILLQVTAILPLSINICQAQHPYFYQYDTKDGLAGSIVYGITQDTDGFIWFATETGLSRFDGNRFTNFTTKDGLPSNEVFSVFSDSKGRIWIGTFKDAVCYYNKGHIYTQENDPVLKKVVLNNHAESFAETEAGEILITTNHRTTYIVPSPIGLILQHLSPKKDIIPTCFQYQLKNSYMGKVPYFALNEQVRKAIRDTNKYYRFTSTNPGKDSSIYIATSDHGFLIIPVPGTIQPYFIRKPDIFYSSCSFLNTGQLALIAWKGGVKLFDLQTRSFTDMYLPRGRVHQIFSDREGNTWIATDGLGVYKVNYTGPVFYPFNSDYQDEGVYMVLRYENSLIVAAGKGSFWGMTRHTPSEQKYTVKKIKAKLTHWIRNENTMMHLNNILLSELVERRLHETTVKTVFPYGDTVLVATSFNLMLLGITKRKILDTLVNNTRITCALKIKDTYFYGSLDGLYAIKQEGSYRTPPKHLLTGNRVTTMTEGADGILWVGSDGDGVTGIKDGKVIARITHNSSKISSDICLSLFLTKEHLWIGTAKGINKVALTRKDYPLVAYYGLNEGILSEKINSLLIEGDTVYAGTQAGLFIFPERHIPGYGSCNIAFTHISISGKPPANLTGSLMEVPPEANNIRFEFSGISLLASKNITYDYRLLGLDLKWKSTSDPYVSFNTLSPGTYNFQVKARNTLGNSSRIIEQQFIVRPAFWERTEVKTAILALVLLGAILLFRLRIRRTQKKEQERYEVQRKLADMKHMALRTQINPHFIFNCLNSIQHFVAGHKAAVANFYIGSFATLIRNTLDNASLLYIPIDKEIEYLNSYLELEQMQFSPAFRFAILSQQLPSSRKIQLPNMIIQPFIENAVKHGVRHLGAEGSIIVEFMIKEEQNALICTVKDNGPGILQKETNNGTKPSTSHISKGLTITEERIQMLNSINRDQVITVQKCWAYTDVSIPYGTLIILTIPL